MDKLIDLSEFKLQKAKDVNYENKQTGEKGTYQLLDAKIGNRNLLYAKKVPFHGKCVFSKKLTKWIVIISLGKGFDYTKSLVEDMDAVYKKCKEETLKQREDLKGVSLTSRTYEVLVPHLIIFKKDKEGQDDLSQPECMIVEVDRRCGWKLGNDPIDFEDVKNKDFVGFLGIDIKGGYCGSGRYRIQKTVTYGKLKKMEAQVHDPFDDDANLMTAEEIAEAKAQLDSLQKAMVSDKKPSPPEQADSPKECKGKRVHEDTTDDEAKKVAREDTTDDATTKSSHNDVPKERKGKRTDDVVREDTTDDTSTKSSRTGKKTKVHKDLDSFLGDVSEEGF